MFHKSYLSGRINSLPIPVELLTEVFKHLVASEDPSLLAQQPSLLACIGLTRVCRYWRDLVRDCPPLWTYIVVSSYTTTSLLRHCMHHSLNAPQDVTMAILPDVPTRLPALEDNVGRIRTLQVCSAFHEDTLRRLFDKEMPMMLRLDIDAFQHLGSPISDLRSVDFVAPPCPSLRSLSVMFMHVYWRKSGLRALSSLKELSLDDCIDKSTLITDVLDVLAAYSLLEDVELRNSLPLIKLGTLGQQRLVPMKNLVRLRLFEAPETIFHLLSHLQLREEADVFLGPMPTWEESRHDTPALRLRRLLPHDTTCLPILRGAVWININSNGTYWRQVQINVLGQAGGSLAMSLDPFDVTQESILADIVDVFAQSPVTRFRYHVNMKCHVFEEVWRAIFSTLPLIEHLRLFGCGSYTTHALQVLSDTPEQLLLLPSLRTLGLACDWPRETAEALLGCLRSRAAQGAPKLSAQFRVETRRTRLGRAGDGPVDKALRELKQIMTCQELYTDVPVVYVRNGPESA
ncbi:hypothetical protein OH76DRAFT_911711 [Lentinus brumalis]|uniref:F-box domain-containing protein n=1 Tax=Lentinus brumalis TaxID=2498619 RepID=A0A371D035_9APHY|nr:hypothetical protein OH76DRAFT_911711 [Polyporus brumalis]